MAYDYSKLMAEARTEGSDRWESAYIRECDDAPSCNQAAWDQWISNLGDDVLNAGTDDEWNNIIAAFDIGWIAARERAQMRGAA